MYALFKKVLLIMLILEVILIGSIVHAFMNYTNIDYDNLTKTNESYKDITLYEFDAEPGLCGFKSFVKMSDGTKKPIIALNNNPSIVCGQHRKQDLFIIRSTLDHEYCHHYRDERNYSLGYGKHWYITMKEEFICSMSFINYKERVI